MGTALAHDRLAYDKDGGLAMSQIRNRVFTERGSSRAPAPFGQTPSRDGRDRSAAPQNLHLTDRKPSGELDETAWSVELGYN
jgi:hypothetical protein